MLVKGCAVSLSTQTGTPPRKEESPGFFGAWGFHASCVVIVVGQFRRQIWTVGFGTETLEDRLACTSKGRSCPVWLCVQRACCRKDERRGKKWGSAFFVIITKPMAWLDFIARIHPHTNKPQHTTTMTMTLETTHWPRPTCLPGFCTRAGLDESTTETPPAVVALAESGASSSSLRCPRASHKHARAHTHALKDEEGGTARVS